jgi:hypothetical protein
MNDREAGIHHTYVLSQSGFGTPVTLLICKLPVDKTIEEGVLVDHLG